jgi:hypothetical protein
MIQVLKQIHNCILLIKGGPGSTRWGDGSGRKPEGASPVYGDKKTIGRVIDYIDARHSDRTDEAKRIKDGLKEKLGRKFEQVLSHYGNPDKDGYMSVRNKWSMEFEGLI